MKPTCKLLALIPPLFILLALQPFQKAIAGQLLLSPTPTYDPLVEPPLPDNPTEYELGRNLYWHWCMTCHGDRGQGLTDEFRAIWEPDHQNCWGRGCHAGRPGDEGFPIPTIVPAIVNDAHLTQFASVQELSNFLEVTHPPQSPGILKVEEYHAVALFVFTMNERPLTDSSIHTPAPALTVIPVPSQESGSNPLPVSVIIILVILVGLLALSRRLHPQK